MFSAGVDLVRLSSGGADYVRAFLPSLARLYDAAFFYPKPVVAAINGHAIAGGCVLACCADRRIMAQGSGRIGITELLVGVPFPALAFEIVRFAVPSRHLPEFTFGAATYDTDAALQRGWVDAVAPIEALMGEAMTAAQQLARLSPRLSLSQETAPPTGQRERRAQWIGDRQDRHRHLGRCRKRSAISAITSRVR